MLVIAKKDFRQYFTSPVGYVCVAVVLALYGFFYYEVISTRSSGYIPGIYSSMLVWCMMIIPILTMRTFNEEEKNRTDQLLLTSPVSIPGIVTGKFAAAALVFTIMTLGSLLPCFFISAFGSPPWALIIGNVIASLAYGFAMIAIGLFVSSMTSSQIIAAIITFAVSMMLILIDHIPGGNTLLNKAAGWISFRARYDSFAQGRFCICDLAFFISVIAIFLFLTVRRIESRRWR